MAEFVVNAIVLKQNGRELYCFGMNSARLRRICYVTPRSEDNPEEIQRILVPRRAREIGEYLKQANALLPNAIVVNLTEHVKIHGTGASEVKALHFPDEEGKFAYILDGQHRLAGFDYSGGIQFDLPVVAIYAADDGLRGKIFADINSKQVPVSDVQLLALYYQIKDLSANDAPVMDVVMRLSSDPDSPLKGRIKTKDTDKKSWVKNVALKQWLAPLVTSGGALGTRTVAEQVIIMKAYLGAIAQLWPNAWGDVSRFNLCRPLGLEIMFGLFSQVKQRCDLNCGKQYTNENFRVQMQPLVSAKINLTGGEGFAIDWQRGTWGILSNRGTRTIVIRQLRDILQRADEE